MPIVAKLAECHTAKEITSISYDMAQQFMGAVLYSIHEGEKAEKNLLVQKEALSLESMYAIGVKCVEEKTKETLHLYNEMMTHFLSYENQCLHDTVVKGLPEFFKWYDCKYEPQNTILTLDYPVLVDISGHTGIDKIYDFVLCIQQEQKFLNKFSPAYVIEVLSSYDKQYKRMIDNICEIVLMNVVSHIAAEKDIAVLHFEPEDYLKLQAWIQTDDLNALRGKLKRAIHVLVREYYENDEKLTEYLDKAAYNISVRMKCAADHGKLCCIV